MLKNYNDIINLSRPVHIDDAIARKHPPMDTGNRAKIFAPFAALKPYEEAVRRKQIITVDRTELSEDQKEELDYTLDSLNNYIAEGEHVMVDVVHYAYLKDELRHVYLRTKGLVAKVDMEAGFIQIVGKKINFSDIYELGIELLKE